MNLMDRVATLGRAEGIRFDRITPLRSTNNIVVWLQPSAVVARIGRDADLAEFEMTVARRLEEVDAPIVGLAEGLERRAHPLGERVVTFWRYAPQDPDATPHDGLVGDALARLHDSLAPATSGLKIPDRPADIASALAELNDGRMAGVLGCRTVAS